MSNRLLVLGHRGATDSKSGVVENSLAAFRAALDQGADGVELDVRLGRDGSLLLHHDPDLADGTPVASLSLHDRPDSMPTLEEALDVLAGALVNIEIKNIPFEEAFDPSLAVVDRVVEVLASRDGADRVIVSSFHPDSVDRVKQLDPDIPTGILGWFAPTCEEVLELARAGGHDAIHPHFMFVTDELVAAAKVAELAVNVWTVNAVDVFERMIELEVDSIITDDIPAALEAVRSSGIG